MVTSGPETSQGTDQGLIRVRRTSLLLSAIAAAGLIVACAWLPWATVKTTSPARSTTFRGGPMSVVLITMAGVTFALVLWQVIRPRRVVAWASLGVAVTSLVLALAISLSKIAAANDVSITGYRQTSYSGGALIGVLTAVMLVAASAVAVSVWTHISSR